MCGSSDLNWVYWLAICLLEVDSIEVNNTWLKLFMPVLRLILGAYRKVRWLIVNPTESLLWVAVLRKALETSFYLTLMNLEDSYGVVICQRCLLEQTQGFGC